MNLPIFASVLSAGLLLSANLLAAASGFSSVPSWNTEGRAFPANAFPTGPVQVGSATYEVRPGAAVWAPGGRFEARTVFAPATPVSATRIAFLHTFHPGRGVADYRAAVAQALRNLELPAAAPEVFRYEIVYADGQTVPFKVRWGEAIEDWYRVQDLAPMLWARDALVQPIDAVRREHAVAYSAVWPNPRPETPIREIRLAPSYDTWINHGEALVLAVTPLTDPPAGRTFYVDPTPVGDDEGPGSFERPYGTIQHALDGVRAGDTVYLRGGLYALNRILELQTQGGEGDRWITLSAFPGETPVIDGTGVLYDASRPQFNGKDQPGPPYQRDRGLLAVHDVPLGHIRVQGLQVQNSQRSGISADGIFIWADRAGKPRPRGLDVSFNTIYNVRDIGINVKFWDDVTVNGNRVVRPHSERMMYHVPGDVRFPDLPAGGRMSQREHAQEAIDLSANDRFEVAYNEVYGGAKEAIDGISVQFGTIHHNTIDSCLNGIYIDAWGQPNTGIKVFRNYIRSAFAGVPCATEGSGNLIDFEIRENIIIEPHMAGIDISEATYKAKPAVIHTHLVHHNTIHRPGYHAAAMAWTGSGLGVGAFPQNPNVHDIIFRDNIVTDAAHTPLRSNLNDLAGRRIRFHHNLIWLDEDRPAEFSPRGSGYLKGEASIVDDPRYVDPARGDFRLRAGSPAIGAGSDGSDVGALPYGVAWRTGYDWTGRPTAYFHATSIWRPVFIAREKFNTFRNNLHRPRFFQQGRYGEDLQALPSGMQALGGVIWNIEPEASTSLPTVITLRGRQSEAPERDVTGITVGRKASRLAFLHTAYVAAERSKDPTVELARYVVRYADGTQVEIPVTAGRNIAHLSGNHTLVPDARIVWSIPVVLRRGALTWNSLYSLEWTNPRPELAIEAIDVLRAGAPANGTIALFAISTAE